MSHSFYKALKYPVPKMKNIFSYIDKKEQQDTTNTVIQSKEFSREKENTLMPEYKEQINKLSRLRKSIPGIKAIYLCNSLTFNALHPKSDIDLFIITKKNRIWRARFRSVLLLTLTNNRRRGKSIRKKFCLSFYVTKDNMNLQNLRLKDGDVYLPYWIAHLVPLYAEEEFDTDSVYKKNKRISHYLTKLPLQQNIHIGTKKISGQTYFKKALDSKKIKHLVTLLDKIIMLIRKPIITFKTPKKENNSIHIIANNDILKFHKDKRRQYYFLFKKQRRSQR